MTYDQMLCVIQAQKNRKLVERRLLKCAENVPFTVIAASTLFDFSTYEYRIKPQPTAWYVNIYDGSVSKVHETYAEAIAIKYKSGRTIRLIEDLSYVESET